MCMEHSLLLSSEVCESGRPESEPMLARRVLEQIKETSEVWGKKKELASDAKDNLKLTQYSGILTLQEADLYYKM